MAAEPGGHRERVPVRERGPALRWRAAAAARRERFGQVHGDEHAAAVPAYGPHQADRRGRRAGRDPQVMDAQRAGGRTADRLPMDRVRAAGTTTSPAAAGSRPTGSPTPSRRGGSSRRSVPASTSIWSGAATSRSRSRASAPCSMTAARCTASAGAATTGERSSTSCSAARRSTSTSGSSTWCAIPASATASTWTSRSTSTTPCRSSPSRRWTRRRNRSTTSRSTAGTWPTSRGRRTPSTASSRCTAPTAPPSCVAGSPRGAATSNHFAPALRDEKAKERTAVEAETEVERLGEEISRLEREIGCLRNEIDALEDSEAYRSGLELAELADRVR